MNLNAFMFSLYRPGLEQGFTSNGKRLATWRLGIVNIEVGAAARCPARYRMCGRKKWEEFVRAQFDP